MAKDTLEDLLRRARAVVFDFDDTLVESNDIKWRGFEAVFGEFAEHLSEIMAYCRGSNHTVRDEKFRHVCEEILGLRYTEDLATALHQHYANATTQLIAQAPEIPGATTFLLSLAGGYTTALLSSTPHEILLQILEQRDMRKHFRHVQGAPVDKAEWLNQFRSMQSLAPKEVVFFGDTPGDLASSRTAGCVFVGLGKEFSALEDCLKIEDFHEICPSIR